MRSIRPRRRTPPPRSSAGRPAPRVEAERELQVGRARSGLPAAPPRAGGRMAQVALEVGLQPAARARHALGSGRQRVVGLVARERRRQQPPRQRQPAGVRRAEPVCSRRPSSVSRSTACARPAARERLGVGLGAPGRSIRSTNHFAGQAIHSSSEDADQVRSRSSASSLDRATAPARYAAVRASTPVAARALGGGRSRRPALRLGIRRLGALLGPRLVELDSPFALLGLARAPGGPGSCGRCVL